MAAPPSVPYVAYETIRGLADAFLAQRHRSGAIPVPIEDIVEFQLRLDIVPVQGLRHAFEIDGFTTSDGSEIHVDAYAQENYPSRYRFTLAHEVGHLVMHAWAYERGNFSSIQGWKDFINAMPEESASRIEAQAHCFAGLILVPASPLRREVEASVARISAAGLRLADVWDDAWPRIEAVVAKTFAVSADVIHRRIEFDHLDTHFRRSRGV